MTYNVSSGTLSLYTTTTTVTSQDCHMLIHMYTFEKQMVLFLDICF